MSSPEPSVAAVQHIADATELAELIRSRQCSSVEVVTAAIERAESTASLGAFVWMRPEQALAEARHADQRTLQTADPQSLPPLHGVPFAVKDWKCTTAGEPMWWGTRLLRDLDHRATVTTELAARHHAAGLISIGRTNLPELAFGPPTTEPDAFAPARNPWQPSLSAGGSSGGSAVAVAAGIVPVANASDGGGSLRIPAACCGLVGLKVSRGRLTVAPHAEGRAIKVEGYFARSVRDVALLLDVLSGPAAGDAPGLAAPLGGSFAAAPDLPTRRLRVGLMVEPPGCMNPDRPVSDRQVAAARWAAETLDEAGHEVVVASPPTIHDPLRTPSLYAAERAVLRRTLESLVDRPLTADDVEPRTWAMFELAGHTDGVSILGEIEAEQHWARSVRRWWDSGWDLLLTPALGRDIPELGELKETADDPLGASLRGYPMAWFSYPFNITGQPAVTIPAPRGDSSVPASFQLVAAVGREDLLLAVAALFERLR
jgi:amidase